MLPFRWVCGREAAANASRSYHVYRIWVDFLAPCTWPKTSVFCTMCVFPCFPRIKGFYQTQRFSILVLRRSGALHRIYSIRNPSFWTRSRCFLMTFLQRPFYNDLLTQMLFTRLVHERMYTKEPSTILIMISSHRPTTQRTHEIVKKIVNNRFP